MIVPLSRLCATQFRRPAKVANLSLPIRIPKGLWGATGMGRKLFAIAVAGMKGLAGASRSATATPAEANRVLEKLAALEARMATLGSENHDLRRRLARGPSRPVPAALSGPIAA